MGSETGTPCGTAMSLPTDSWHGSVIAANLSRSRRDFQQRASGPPRRWASRPGRAAPRKEPP